MVYMIKRDSLYKKYSPCVISPLKKGENAWWFIFASDKLLVKLMEGSAEIPFVKSPEELNLSPIREQYLGTYDGVHCYSAEVSEEMPASADCSFNELRSLFGLMADDLFLLAGRAKQIVSWDQSHQYCGSCGSLTETKSDERAKLCPICGSVSYPRISPAVIVAVTKGRQILLAHAKHFRGNMYSIIAGFLEPGETLEECVERELMEEVGIKVKNIKYFGSQPWPFPNSLMIGFTAEYDRGEIKVDGVEIGDANWFEKGNLPEIPSKMSIARKLIDWFISV